MTNIQNSCISYTLQECRENMISTISIYTGGVLSLLIAIFHIKFPTIFNWTEAFENISGLNRRVFYTLHLALLLLIAFLGIFTLTYAGELGASQGMALGFNAMVATLWFWRSIWQIVYFKGKAMHYLLTTTFFLLFACYALPIALNLI